jgi:hypothetical protein
MVGAYIKSSISMSYDKARKLEETRRKYEVDLSEIFNSIEAENKEIGKLL